MKGDCKTQQVLSRQRTRDVSRKKKDREAIKTEKARWMKADTKSKEIE